MKIFSKKAKDIDKENAKIIKSQKIIEKEKNKIRIEKDKIKAENEKIKAKKYQKFFSTKFGKFIKKIFFLTEENNYKPPTIKKQILSMIYFELVGAVICLIILFIILDGKNYLESFKELSKLIDTYNTIKEDYYGNLDKQKLIDSAISSMLSSVDDKFTNYSNEEETNNFLENVEGTYEGIGAQVTTNDEKQVIIVEVFKDSPADKAGLKENDIVLKVDNKDFTKKTSEDVANYIKESKNNKIKLTIKRNNEEKELTIERKKIDVPTVSNKIIEKNGKKIGYIYISIFTSVTNKQFEKNLEKLEKENIDSLIIDVRDNNGGYLTTVTDIISQFLEKGKIIYQLSDKSGTKKIKDKTKEKRNYPIAVLINQNSASASEILASAIKESYNGHVVGVNSYGKGTVQKTKKLKDGSMIKYTIQKWLTPNGNWINEKGVKPTDYIEYNIIEEDNQLNKAVDVLIGDLNK